MDYADLADAEIENTIRKNIIKASGKSNEPKSTTCKNCEDDLNKTSLEHFCSTACLKDFEKRLHINSILGKKS